MQQSAGRQDRVAAQRSIRAEDTIKSLPVTRSPTSVHDAPDKRRHTEQLLEIQAGRHEAFVSDIYTREVRGTESPLRRAQLEAVPSVYNLAMLQSLLAAYDLLDKYVDAKAFTSNNDVDGLHVAVATLAACEVVVSGTW